MEKEMNEPLAFRTALSTAIQTALGHAKLSATMASQAVECARLGTAAQRVLDMIPMGEMGCAEPQRAVRTHFSTVNLSVTEVRRFIQQARDAKVDTENKSLISMRNNLRTIECHMRMLHALINKWTNS